MKMIFVVNELLNSITFPIFKKSLAVTPTFPSPHPPTCERHYDALRTKIYMRLTPKQKKKMDEYMSMKKMPKTYA